MWMDTDTLEKSMEESYQTEHTLSVMYPGEMKTPVLTKTYTWIFTEDELLRARNWKQSKCLLRGEWMARLLALGYYLVTKRNRLLVYAISWTERRGFEVSKKTLRSPKVTCCAGSFAYRSWNDKMIETESRSWLPGDMGMAWRGNRSASCWRGWL